MSTEVELCTRAHVLYRMFAAGGTLLYVGLPDRIRDYLAWYQRLPGARPPGRPPQRESVPGAQLPQRPDRPEED